MFYLLSTIIFISGYVLPVLPESRIVGGSDTRIIHHPYMVSIQTNSGHFCGGSILSNRYVLTAARCVTSATSSLKIRAGSSFHKRGGSLHNVDWNVTHENWEKGADMAILRIKDKFEFDSTRQPIRFYNATEKIIGGTFCNITGWGMTSENATENADQLQLVTTRVVDNYTCNAVYSKTSIGYLNRGQICAGKFGTGGQDSCYGDTGSPLVIKNRQYGISSFGIGCGRKRYPGIYTNVGYYSSWIENHVSI